MSHDKSQCRRLPGEPDPNRGQRMQLSGSRTEMGHHYERKPRQSAWIRAHRQLTGQPFFFFLFID